MNAIKIDSHQHFWNLNRDDYHWLNPDMHLLYKNFLPTDIEPFLEKASIDKTILVQAASTVEETIFLLSLANENDFIAGVVGWVDLESDDTGLILKELLKHPKFIGVRPMIQDIDDLDWMLSSSLEKNINLLIEYKLTFDALVQPKHLGNFLKFLERYSELKVVIDHGAKPNIAIEKDEKWFEQIKEIAFSTKAYCKLSGLLTEIDGYPNQQQLLPYCQHLYSCFGASRLMWGSDWPVINMKSDYPNWLKISSKLLSNLSEIEKENVFGITACQFYGLDPKK